MAVVPVASQSWELSDERTQNLAPLLIALENQQSRFLRSVHTLSKQAEQALEANQSFEEKERRRSEKLAQIQNERHNQQEQRDERALKMEELRQARLDAAAKHEEGLRQVAEAKIRAVNERLVRFAEERVSASQESQQRAAQAEARRAATYRSNQQLMESRRNQLLDRQQRVEEILQQREQLRQLQTQIRAEEDFLRAQHRDATKARAEQDLAARVAWYQSRIKAKDNTTTQKMKELDNIRRLRAGEAQQRAEYIAAAAREAAAINEAERARKAEVNAAKQARAEQLAAQRAALIDEMRYLRQQMQQQEDALRVSLTRMRQKRSLALPAEVVAQLEALAAGGPLRTSSSLARLTYTYTASATSPHAVGIGSGKQRSPQPLLLTHATGPATPRARSARPKSAASTPRDSGRPRYLTTAYSPSASPGPGASKAKAKGQAGARGARPLSASVDFGPGGVTTSTSRRADVMRSSATGTGITSANRAANAFRPTTGAAHYTTSMASPRPGATNTAAAPSPRDTAAAAAAGAAAAGRYSSVSEVGRPGSRREEELRAVLQDEIGKEGERQALLAKVADDTERVRLIKIFAAEREQAKQRILALSSAAQAPLQPYH